MYTIVMVNAALTRTTRNLEHTELMSYMAFSDKSFDGPEVFSKKPYDSYEAFVEEFKRKFEKYLPSDFDWDAHLGRFNYAAYAITHIPGSSNCRGFSLLTK